MGFEKSLGSLDNRKKENVDSTNEELGKNIIPRKANLKDKEDSNSRILTQ